MTKKATTKTKQRTHHPRQTAASHKKVFDVIRPGKIPASPTSRPVIVKHQPAIQDDQLIPGAPPLHASDPAQKHPLMDAKQKVELKPLSSEEKSAPPSPIATVADASEAIAVKVVSGNASVPSAEEEQPIFKATKPTSSPEMAAVEERQQEEANAGHLALEQVVQTEFEPTAPTALPAAQTNAAPTPSIASSAPTAPSAAVRTLDELLAESGPPVLDEEPAATHAPVVSHHKRGLRWWEVLLITIGILVLAAIALNFLLDAELIQTSLNLPHTDVIQ